EISGRAAAQAGLTLARKTDTGAIFDTRRDIDREGALARGTAEAPTRPTGCIDHLAASVAARTGPLQREEPLGVPDLTLPPAGRANLGFGAGLCAISTTGFARNGCGYADLSALAAESLFEGQFHVVAQIGAALAARTAAAPTAPHTKKIIENVSEGRREFSPKPRPTAALPEARITEPVGGATLMGILEDLIGLVDFLKAMLGLIVARIAIRMEFHGKLAVSGLQISIVGIAMHAKDLVIIALGHATSPRHKATAPCRMPEGRRTSRRSGGWIRSDIFQAQHIHL